MNTSKTEKYKTGIYIGKFFPMHLGHVSTIDMLSSACENTFVIFYNDKKAEEKLINQAGYNYTIDLRANDAKKIFEHRSNIVIIKLDVPNDIVFPDDYEDIKIMVQNIVGDEIDIQIFGCDEEAVYAPFKYADKYMLGCIYDIENNQSKITPLHSTLIRNDYYYYKKYLPSIVEQSITKLKKF